MFRPIDIPAAEQRQVIHIFIGDRKVAVSEGQTLATAMLGAGMKAFRKTAVSGAPRAPLCLMGVCFDCLVEVNGSQNVQACLVEVKEGMQVRVQTGARRADVQEEHKP